MTAINPHFEALLVYLKEARGFDFVWLPARRRLHDPTLGAAT